MDVIDEIWRYRSNRCRANCSRRHADGTRVGPENAPVPWSKQRTADSAPQRWTPGERRLLEVHRTPATQSPVKIA